MDMESQMKRVVKVFAGLLVAASSQLASAETIHVFEPFDQSALYRITAQGTSAVTELKFEFGRHIDDKEIVVLEMKELMSDSVKLPGGVIASVEESISADSPTELAD